MEINRQYIGARYVPKFFDNPDGSNNWVSNTSYEALTIVQYNNASYTSKITVPANVGNPSENPQYWALTGNYNGQVEGYRTTTEEYKQSVDTYKSETNDKINVYQSETNEKIKKKGKRKFVYIGDSLSVGYSHETPENNYKGFYYWFAQAVGDENVEWITPAGIGGGFVATDGHVWLEHLKYHVWVNFQPEDATDIVCLGGTNDTSASVENVEAAISAFCAYCKETMPYAKLSIGALCDGLIASDVNARYKCAPKYGAFYITSLLNLLTNPDDFDASGYTHLSQAGYLKFSPYVNNCILNGSCDYTHFYWTTASLVENEFKFDSELSGGLSELRVGICFKPTHTLVYIDARDDNKSATAFLKATNVWKENKIYTTETSNILLKLDKDFRPACVDNVLNDNVPFTLMHNNGAFGGKARQIFMMYERKLTMFVLNNICGNSSSEFLYMMLSEEPATLYVAL